MRDDDDDDSPRRRRRRRRRRNTPACMYCGQCAVPYRMYITLLTVIIRPYIHVYIHGSS
jgi:hypothetical protein